MALNPIAFTENVVRSFLRYQLTTYHFADRRLNRQMRKLLSLDETRNSPLLAGPYVSLSRSFRQGASIASLISEGILHPLIAQRAPHGMTNVYWHQEEGLRAIHAKKTTVISTGTGSGKTECFLYPIVSRCLQLKDQGTAPGICAVIVYPMNALAEDQLGRLRKLLAGTDIPFGMYVGKTPNDEAHVTGVRLPQGSSLADYGAKLTEVSQEGRSDSVHPPEERCSRQAMRHSPPRILLTNIKQLELLLTRQQDVQLFDGALLDYLVFDEAHTFTGAMGAETACLTRRLRNFCGKSADDTVCIATSATIIDRDEPDAARVFASRFFGVAEESIATVCETYDSEVWDEFRTVPPAPDGELKDHLQACVQAVDADQMDEAIRQAYKRLSSSELGGGPVPEALHASLSHNELIFQVNQLLQSPMALVDLCSKVGSKLDRAVSEEEILAWLTFGAAARKEGRPLLRPVVHGFIRGISGAVVSFPENEKDPKLSLSSHDDIDDRESSNGKAKHAHFPVTTCTTCGQHYFVAYLNDFRFTGKNPEGGSAAPDRERFWEPSEDVEDSARVVLTDQLHGEDDDQSAEDHNHTATLYFCRHCRAAHPGAAGLCLNCGASGELVKLQAIRQGDSEAGVLRRCISCRADGRRIGGRYREPARAVRAANAADVHVLAQDMVHHAERQRLLVFCDNRQDAAFQAGWMKDHARRFRLRALMAEALSESPHSVGDLTHFLDERIGRNDALSQALLPEVWRVARKEAAGHKHGKERRKFLRIQVLREVSLALRQVLGLEPWGRMKIKYVGLNSSTKWVLDNAKKLNISAEELRDGVACILDHLRRKRILYDAEYEIFSHYWLEGDQEIQAGYLPKTGGIQGTKFARDSSEKSDLVVAWIGARGKMTAIQEMVLKWGVEQEALENFLRSMYGFLRDDLRLLKPVQLKGSGARRRPLPNISGLYQVDADLLKLVPNHGYWKCGNCSRIFTRQVPGKKCPAWKCDGNLGHISEKSDPDNYHLELLDKQYTMLKPAEHTAMVPAARRERLENFFKGDSDVVNCLACTPTLEIGIDIGKLDAILMRNVPPLPTNYWQRSGRAGRRHRMAVNFTYCRPASHDIAYFDAPLKMLNGPIEPPSFNMRNILMVEKHVHATILTLLHQRARDTSCSVEERQRINDTLQDCIPQKISHYLFQSGGVRTDPFDLSALESLIRDLSEYLSANVEVAFSSCWPETDTLVVSRVELRRHVEETVAKLGAVVERLRRRLDWAMGQIKRLNNLQNSQGTLDKYDKALHDRCGRQINRLKGVRLPGRHEAEGYDDINTYGVLAAEGFLPGYGLEIGSVRGEAEIPFWEVGAMNFSLPRPLSTALREYVPGNLIYANGNKFVPRRFRFNVDEGTTENMTYEVSVSSQAVKEVPPSGISTSMETAILPTKPVSDVDLIHQSHISDEEEFRFQMSVCIYGYECQRHNGGKAWNWGGQALQHRKAVALRLVNVGTASLVAKSKTLGYRVCQVCGMSNSPFSSDREQDNFLQGHITRCGREPEPIGFHADVFADVLSLPECESREVAYSVLEALRSAAARVLDMHVEDLQVLVIGHTGRDDVDGLLWDTMPGGSGLLDQLCARFPEIVRTASEIASHCSSGCQSSCVDCLRTFRNAYYHKYLDRKRVQEKMKEWNERLTDEHDIPPLQTSTGSGGEVLSVNQAETKLGVLLTKAGFGNGVRGEQIHLDPALGSTTPDVIYRAAFHKQNEGVCIYLDGLSRYLHGNPQTAERDRMIRDWLRNNGYEVIEIAVSDLDDKNAMVRHFRRLAVYLQESNLRQTITETDWF